MSDKLIALIEKLNNKNYHHWALRMKVFLTKESCWDSITTDCPTEAAGKTAWEAKNAKAHQFIILSVGNDQLVLVHETTTAKEAWEKLKSYHQKSAISIKVRLLRKLCKTELPRDGNMEKHLLEMSEGISQLKESGYKLDDDMSMFLLLSSVNEEEYGSLITALEARDEKTLTVEVIRNKLLEEYEKRKEHSLNDLPGTAFKFASGNRKFGRGKKRCYHCNKEGHYKNECRAFKNLQERKFTHERKFNSANSAVEIGLQRAAGSALTSMHVKRK